MPERENGPDNQAGNEHDGQADAFLLQSARAGFFPDRPARVGVAVSGGSDSMAALHLLHAAGYAVEAATVDHGLRPEAADEARFVADACAALRVPHETLSWQPEGEGNLMDRARRARYALLARWARGRGLSHVAVAHTADDQAETFLMRLAREAGLDGLSAMRSNWRQDGVAFHRPFLIHTRARLRGYLTRLGVVWVEDPTNSDPRYDRVKARKALAELAALGITAEGLSNTAMRLASARMALQWQAFRAAEALAREEAGDVVYDRHALAQEPQEIRRRLLIAALRFISGADYPPRERSLRELEQAVDEGRDATLVGVRMFAGEDALRFTREARAVTGMECATTALWDGRWRLIGPHAPGLTLRALTAEGLLFCDDWRATGLDRQTLAVSPAVWQGPYLVAAPLAGKAGEWQAELAKGRDDLSQFILSH